MKEESLDSADEDPQKTVLIIPGKGIYDLSMLAYTVVYGPILLALLSVNKSRLEKP